jgi:hypothetical protein
MNERILNLLSLCMQAKEKGHDCFFDYAPHVEKAEVKVYIGGWKDRADANYTFVMRQNGVTYPDELGIDTAEVVLKGLIA